MLAALQPGAVAVSFRQKRTMKWQMSSLWQAGPPMSQRGSPSSHDTLFPFVVPPSTSKTA
jgi:hypothetical protein